MNQQLNIDVIINQHENILKTMLVLSKHLSLYDEDNAVVQTASAKLLSGLKAAQAANLPVQISVAKNNFMVLGELLNPNNQLFSKYAYRMFQHGITTFTLTAELTIPSLYRFLRVIMGSPDDTWKADGIINLLEQKQIDGIIVTQMSRKDFLLVDGKDQADKNKIRSVADHFWERYARSLISAFADTDLDSLAQTGFDPALLARRLSLLLTGTTGEEQSQFNKALIRCITTTQAHYPKSERLEILIKLAELINHFDDEPRQEIVKELCKLPIPKTFAEDLCNNLSNKVILNALYQATSGQNYSSPMMLSLVMKLAESREVVSQQEINRLSRDEKGFLKKAGELLSNEDIAQYVPAEYQKTLLDVLADQQPPTVLSRELKSLKTSLEHFQIDLQTAQLSLYLLEHGPDKNQMPALYQQLVKSLQFYLDAGDFAGTLALCRSIFTQANHKDTQFPSNMIPSSLLKQAVTAACYQGKDHRIMLGDIIDLVGSPFISPLLELTISETNRTNRFFYLSCLKKLGQQVIDAAASYLDNNQWYVVRNMLLLLGELEAKEQLPRIRPLLNHSHTKVRQEALKTCLLLGDTLSIKEIMAGLHSKNRQEALNAILMTKLINHAEITKHLLAMLGEKSLFNFDLELKKNLVQALAEKVHPGALGVFSKILNGRNLFHRQGIEQLKIEIIRVLAKYPADQADPLLRQQLNKGNVEAANLARQILQRNKQEKNP
ncbi:HEAT repeat domain-containing protein [Pelovirga terrestris]|uniref:HEAT repeat domain-containing protein n=1 Tax=Pelovirga terrestris TaxID=2771352 RepID=A0A8J6R4F6_9BACT|nr:HEAT repeat domain-containing protein [Pelovirga terrestris]MBD1399084.1 HEAT repeat domain-containing protein [Pelovirga terrestris]